MTTATIPTIPTITAAAEDVRSADAEQLIRELSAELAALYQVSDGSADFKPEDVEAPRSAFVIARYNGYPVGCGALRPLDEQTGEVKRMYTRSDYRRQGVAQAVLAELERLAARPTREDMLARVHSRRRVTLKTSAAALIRDQRDSA